MNIKQEKNSSACGEYLPEKDRRRSMRRMRELKADRRRRRIIELPRYYPKGGYYKYRRTYDPLLKRTVVIADKRYIHYQKNSKGEQYLKNLSNRRVRRLAVQNIRGKGNLYRKFFEYHWSVS